MSARLDESLQELLKEMAAEVLLAAWDSPHVPPYTAVLRRDYSKYPLLDPIVFLIKDC